MKRCLELIPVGLGVTASILLAVPGHLLLSLIALCAATGDFWSWCVATRVLAQLRRGQPNLRGLNQTRDTLAQALPNWWYCVSMVCVLGEIALLITGIALFVK